MSPVLYFKPSPAPTLRVDAGPPEDGIRKKKMKSDLTTVHLS